jgi:hypothetical protein
VEGFLLKLPCFKMECLGFVGSEIVMFKSMCREYLVEIVKFKSMCVGYVGSDMLGILVGVIFSLI